MAATRDDLYFTSRRPSVIFPHGSVGCAQPLAANIGLDILKQGGNAADAAVAVAAAMALTQPTSNGIGGDGFVLYYDASQKTVRGLNGSGRCPAALTLQRVNDDGFNELNPIPRDHGHAVSVPGAAATWVDTHSNFGSGTLTLANLLQPAIDLAENGYPVSQLTSRAWELSEYLFLDPRNIHGGDMLINGRAPKWGEVFKNPRLTETFRAVAQQGKAGFYEGRIAQAIVDAVGRYGGVMSVGDLRNHTSTLVDPVFTDFKGHRMYEIPPNGQGIIALMILNILEAYDLQALGHNTGEYLHRLIEATRLSFADGLYYIADPDHVSVPIAGMLDKNYAAQRRGLINPDLAMDEVPRGTPPGASDPLPVGDTPEGKDTVYFTVTDRTGNACSFIQSNYAGFGTGIVPEGCGFTLQNRANNFSLEPNHPNVLAPNKRPYHTIIPCMVTNTQTGDLEASYGVMGGFMQPQGHVQVFLNMAVFGMTPQEALDKPRYRVTSAGANPVGAVTIEEGVAQEAVDALVQKGHSVSFPATGHSRGGFGRGHVITKGAWWLPENRVDTVNDPQVWWAGSDARADGLAVGY